MLWALTRVRSEGAALMFGYFAAGARDLPRGAVVFFGDVAPRGYGIGLWLAVCGLLSVPFAICWSRRAALRMVGFAVATVLCAAPPIGIVGWLNPLSAAGVLFPAWGWAGLALTLLVFSTRSQSAWLLVGLSAIMANLCAPTARPAPALWQGFDTQFARLSSAGGGYAAQRLASMVRIDWVKRSVAQMPPNAVAVLPETLIGSFDGVTEGLLADAERELAAKNSRVLVGAELPHGQGYENAVVVLGAGESQDRDAVQGIPVPISMWKPWTDDGAVADLLARRDVINVQGLRVAVSVCYEHLLTYSQLRLMARSPDLLVAVSNVWWASATNIPLIQMQSVGAFARLFNVPVVSARNI